MQAPSPEPGPTTRKPAATPPVEVRDVRVTFATRRGRLTALDGISLTIAPGEIVAVVGPSGCGKTTLLELVCGLQSPDAGIVSGPEAVLMPQRDLLLPWASALDNAALALRAQGVGRDPARAAARTWLERLGLAEFADARPDALSGGMRQRISFVRSLLAASPVLALDEPFAALDALTRAETQVWLAEALTEAPRTVLLVTHDVEEAVVLADRIAVMSPRPGRIVAAVDNPLPRPRRRTDGAVVTLRERVLDALGGPR